MGTKKKSVSQAKSAVAQVLTQAKESLKILSSLEKGTIAKAISFVRIPTASERKKLRDDKILSSLRKLGVATQSEVEALNLKIQKLETALHRAEQEVHKH